MPSVPRVPVRSAVHKAADLQIAAAGTALRLAGRSAEQINRQINRRLPGPVAGPVRLVVDVGVGGAQTVIGLLRREQQPPAPPDNGAAGPAPLVGVPGGPATDAPTGTAAPAAPVAPTPAPEALAVGAPGVATEAADAAELDAVEQGLDLDQAVVDHDALPIPSYDQQTVGSLRPKLQRLDIDQLVQLRAYEQAHAKRIQVLTMLENRIAKLRRQAEKEAQQEAQQQAADESGSA